MTLQFDRFEQVGPSRGTAEGGLYKRDDGTKWYLKYPDSRRQGQNEIMAARFYDEMGFDAVQYQRVDNGMLASEWREGLPRRSEPQHLKESDTVQEVFLPSALVANWDVMGLQYENALYDPSEMFHPVFLDFGGAFDTRAMGGHKRFGANSVPALDGFTDPSINGSAAFVFEGMTPSLYSASQSRVRRLSAADMERVVSGIELDGETERLQRLQQRRELLLGTDYNEVFE